MSTRAETAARIDARYRVGEWVVQPSLNRVSRGGETVQLGFKAMDLLLFLAGRAGKVVDKRELIDTVWQTEYVADNTLAKRIAEIRDAFGDDARSPHYIETIPKRGYRLIADVTLIDGSSHGCESSPVGDEVDESSPYPGLEPFTEADADVFFGRESEIAALWRRIAGRRLLAVVGPSGAGKSSLLRAGVVARAPPGWRAVVCHPGDEPFLALARALAPDLAGDAEEMHQLLGFHNPDVALAVAARWRGRWEQALVVVDQFEELFTLNPEPVRESFVNLVRRLADAAGVHIVLAMRDDFLLECHRYPELAPIFADLTPVGPPTGHELRRALTEPAARRLYAFDGETLVDEMVAQVEAERGALPLLAFAVSRLWELRDRERRILTRSAYEAIGGVGGALARHAEATLEAIGRDKLPLVRELFRNLMTAQGTRAVRRVDDLLSVFDDARREEARAVLGSLIDARLLTSFEDKAANGAEASPDHRVEIVHESLLEAWPRLVGWRTQDADAAQLRDQLRQAAQTWDDAGRSDDLLWTGAAFRRFAVWQEGYPGGLSATEQCFADAMARHAARRARRKRLIVAAVLVTAAAVAAVTTVLWHRADLRARQLEVRRLCELARQEMARCPPRALASAQASLELLDTPDGRRLALEALWRSPMPVYLTPEDHPGPDEIATMVADFSPDGRWLVSDDGEDGLVLWARSGGAPTMWQTGFEYGGLFTPDSRAVCTEGFDGKPIAVWSVPGARRIGSVQPKPARQDGSRDTFPDTREANNLARLWRLIPDPTADAGWRYDDRIFDLLRRLPGERYPPAAVGPRGERLLAAVGDALELYSLDEPDAAPLRLERFPAPVEHVAWQPGGEVAATIDIEGTIRLWSLAGDEPVLLRSWAGEGDRVVCSTLVVDATGHSVAAVRDDGIVILRTVDEPPGADPMRLLSGGWRGIRAGFLPDGRWLAVSDFGGGSLWPVARERYPFVLPGHTGGVPRLEFTPDGSRLMSVSLDGTVRQWPMRHGEGHRPEVLHDWGHPIQWALADMDVSPDGRFAVAVGGDRSLRLIPLDGEPSRPLGYFNQRPWVAAVGPDGRRVAACGLDGTRVWDLETGLEAEVETELDLTCLARTFAFSPDGSALLVADEDVQRLDMATGEHSILIEDHGGRFVLSADGSTMLTDSPGVVVHNLELDVATPLDGHGEQAGALDRSGSIAVTFTDTTIFVGPTTSGPVHWLIADEPVWSVAVSPDGRFIASGHDDGTIRLWPMPDASRPILHDLPRDELLAVLKTRLDIVTNDLDPKGAPFRVGPFPGWETFPAW